MYVKWIELDDFYIFAWQARTEESHYDVMGRVLQLANTMGCENWSVLINRISSSMMVFYIIISVFGTIGLAVIIYVCYKYKKSQQIQVTVGDSNQIAGLFVFLVCAFVQKESKKKKKYKITHTQSIVKLVQ